MIKLGFIGFGLIGASVAKSLKTKAPGEYECMVYDYHTDANPALERALSDEVISSITKKLTGLVGCDVIFLCAPTLKNIKYLSQLKEAYESVSATLPLITDVGSVKGNIVEAAQELGIGSHFIGGHPMAGSEKTGYDSANDHLLENAYYILTPAEGSSAASLELLKDIVKKTGAVSIVLDCKEHDRVTAAISHVPHIIAVELVNLVQDSGDDTPTMKMLAAGGFKDITRIASSSPDMWQSIFMSNKEAILDCLDRYQDALVRVEAAVISSDADYIYKTFERAGEFRSSIPNAHGMMKPEYKCYVDIEDKVGAIATVATQLVTHDISLKNIGIVNNRDYEQGVLRIEFYDAGAKEAAIKELETSGYTVFRAD